MELSTIINAESSLHRKLCLRVDVAMLASTLANGGSPDPYLVPEKDLDKFEDDEEKVRVLERHRDYLEFKLRLKEQQEQHKDDLKSCLETKACGINFRSFFEMMIPLQDSVTRDIETLSVPQVNNKQFLQSLEHQTC